MFFPGIFAITVKFVKSAFNCYYMFSPRTISYVKSLESNGVIIKIDFASDMFKNDYLI
jgi:hypothetical protein